MTRAPRSSEPEGDGPNAASSTTRTTRTTRTTDISPAARLGRPGHHDEGSPT